MNKTKFTIIELILMTGKIAVPLIATVIVERINGPGYSASAKEIFSYATSAIRVLGVLSFWNLQKAMTAAPEHGK